MNQNNSVAASFF